MASDNQTSQPEKKAIYKLEGEYLYRGVVFCSIFPKETLDAVPSFDFREDDILIATYPKSGTTWMQEIAYGIVNDGNLGNLEDKSFTHRAPFLEVHVPGRSGFELLPTMPSPRLIKTHLGREFFDSPIQKNVKAIVVLRNVKDVLVSYYHYYQFLPQSAFKGDFSEFFELFRHKKICFGDWFDWNLGWWKERENPNVLFVKYEDMQDNIHKETRRVCDFLGKEIPDEKLQVIIDTFSFMNMKARQMSLNSNEKKGAGQMRKGTVGDWKNYFTQEQIEYVDNLIATRLEGTGLEMKES